MHLMISVEKMVTVRVGIVVSYALARRCLQFSRLAGQRLAAARFARLMHAHSKNSLFTRNCLKLKVQLQLSSLQLQLLQLQNPYVYI